jgi:hypothetical protein
METIELGAISIQSVNLVNRGALIARFNTVVGTVIGPVTIFRCTLWKANDGHYFVKGPSYANPKAANDTSARSFFNPIGFGDEKAQANITATVIQAIKDSVAV